MKNIAVVAMLLFAVHFGSLALPGQCRPHLRDTTRSSTAPTMNSTFLYGRKFNVIFCTGVLCSYFGGGYEERTCYCCPDVSRRENCHKTMQECRANCALCKPKCLP